MSARDSLDRFANGAARRGSAAGYQLVVVSGEQLEKFDLPADGTVTIGRAQTNQICIDHPSVSRQHARLRLGSSLFIDDLGGSNGTFVRDSSRSRSAEQTQHLRRLVDDSAELAVGEQILIGAVSAILRRSPETTTAAPGGGVVEGAPEGTIIQSDKMRELYAEALRAAQAPISVLILGETGVGKELLARAIHTGSPRAARPFMAINCATLGETVLEGELFGYERGAFTGAVQARPGLFEAADGGTVFLDEVGELPLPTQAKLLRVVEERSLMRLGGRSLRSVNIRLVSATNRDLETEVQAGRFRQDLFYRLNGITLTIPPLRERLSEIRPLVFAFVATFCRQLDRPAFTVSDGALRVLESHAWPGNIRELRNVIERAVVLCADQVVGVEHLPSALTRRDVSPPKPPGVAPTLASDAPAAPAVSEIDDAKFQAQILALDRARILEALARSAGNQTQAAKLLGISRRTLVSRLSQLGLPRPRRSGGST